VVRVPPGLSASATAAVQPLVGAVHAHEVAAFRPGERMLVLGAGVMGLLATQLARRDSPGLLAVAGRSPAKLALAARFGADLVLDATVDDVEKAVRDATEGVGVDVVIETAGGAPGAGLAGTGTLELAVRCVRRGGRIVVVSVLPDRAEVPLGTLRERAVTLLHPPSGGAATFHESLRLVAAGEVDVESLVTHRLTGIDALPEAVEITGHKGRYGAINPAQVDLTGEVAWPS
jgi:threonine dehydrogenase-like Zn-dependent dehydrogenase